MVSLKCIFIHCKKSNHIYQDADGGYFEMVGFVVVFTYLPQGFVMFSKSSMYSFSNETTF